MNGFISHEQIIDRLRKIYYSITRNTSKLPSIFTRNSLRKRDSICPSTLCALHILRIVLNVTEHGICTVREKSLQLLMTTCRLKSSTCYCKIAGFIFFNRSYPFHLGSHCTGRDISSEPFDEFREASTPITERETQRGTICIGKFRLRVPMVKHISKRCSFHHDSRVAARNFVA